MLMKIDLNMMFWSDNHPYKQRERNALFTFNKLKELSNYLTSHFEVKCSAYDYSPEKILPEALHIPYPPTVYKRSEKINNLLKNSVSDLFSVIDSDCFIDPNCYSNLLSLLLKEDSASVCYTFDFCDLSSEDSHKVIYENADPNGFPYNRRYPGRISTLGGLGGFFIVGNNVLSKHGGFNEKFIYWGGEDGEIYDKINQDLTVKKIVTHIAEVKIYHLSHETNREDINYYNNEYYIKHQQK